MENFESIKKDIIAHLKNLEKNENAEEMKKAIEYFNSTESNFSFLEKSTTGWIEKAGYGVGTIRIWKGKKYKKISTNPTRWVRVFDKVSRGSKNALTRLIHQAEKIDNPEDMLQFVLLNKQRFVDENGKSLDIVDRLNAVIEGKEYSSSKKAEVKTDKPSNKNIMSVINKPEDATDSELKEALDVLQSQLGMSEELVREEYASYTDKKVVKEYPGYIKKIENEISNRKNKDTKGDTKSNDKPSKSDVERSINKLQMTGLMSASDIQAKIDNYREIIKKGEKPAAVLDGIKEKIKILESDLYVANEAEKYSDLSTYDQAEKLREVLLNDKKVAQSYWIQDSKGNRINNNDAMQKIRNNLDEIDKLYGSDTPRKDMKIRDLENYNEDIISKLIPEERKEMESEQKKHQNRSDAMKGNDNAKKDNAKPTITFDRNGRLGEKAVNTKLGTDNIKALDALPEKFFDGQRNIIKYPSEVEIDGEKKFAYTNGQFLVVTHDIPANGVKTKQSEKIEGNYPNVERVIPKEFKDNSAPKVDINIDQIMKDLPKVDFSKKAFNDDSHKQFMKIGNFWYDAKMVKATYDMLKGDNAEVLESKDTYSNGRFGRLCIKTDKGYSVIVSSSNDYADKYAKQSIYNSDEGSMSADAKAEYEIRKKTGLPDTYFNNAVSFGYKPDSKGMMYGDDKDIGFKANGDKTEFYYKGIPTGIKNLSSYMYGKKENLDTYVENAKKTINARIDDYKEGKKNPAKMPANYDKTFPNMTNENLTDIYKWWSDNKNIEKLIYQGMSSRKGVPGIGSYYIDSRKIGAVEDSVMKMLPDIKEEIKRRGITIKKSIDGELIFETSLETYVRKSIADMKKSLIG